MISRTINFKRHVAITAAYTASLADDIISMDGTTASFSLTLPSAAKCAGKVYVVRRTDHTPANWCGINPSVTTLYSKNECVTLLSDGANWLVIARDYGSDQFNENYTVTVTPLSGNTSQNRATWQRVRNGMQVRHDLSYIGPEAAQTLLIKTPNTKTIDIASGNWQSMRSCVGTGSFFDAGVGFLPLQVYYYDTTTLCLAVSGSGNLLQGNQLANDDRISFSYWVPISGWK